MQGKREFSIIVFQKKFNTEDKCPECRLEKLLRIR